MTQFLLNNVFRIAVSTLNFVFPSIIADIFLHPFDFATVLLQIGYAPEGCKYEAATLVSVIVHYALFTFYIPYLLTSVQGLQFMGMPHPNILHYVSYIYKREGFAGCYRGLVPKICERFLMISVNENVRRRLDKEFEGTSDFENGREFFLQSLINGLCSQFFAVLASHPFHVLMVSSFSEFTCNKKSSIMELSYSIYKGSGYFGFFKGFTARLLGELLSQTFSVTYTTIINKHMTQQQQTVVEIPTPHVCRKTASIRNCLTELPRFTALKPKSVGSYELRCAREEDYQPNVMKGTGRLYKFYVFLLYVLGSIIQNTTPERDRLRRNIRRRHFPLLAYRSLTSTLFYHIMIFIRDFFCKKISNPFLKVCHCAIILDAGWDKFPLLTYFGAFKLISHEIT